jgi:hypothetical protein
MMASKPKKTPAPEKFPRKAVPLAVTQADGEPEIARKQTALFTSPEMAAMRVIKGAESKSGYWESIDVPSLIEQLREQSAAVSRNDLAQVEAMLMNQATALQSLFARLAERGMTCDTVPGFEANFRMALRSQSQCRATLETLAAIKNPPVIYAKQANVTTGPQQINNGTAAPSQAGKNEIEQSQQSGGSHELLPDTRASGNESRVNPAMETLGEIDRAEVPRG